MPSQHARQRRLLAAALALGALSCGGPEAPGPERRPNVLLVTLDTTRADALGSYGHPADPTPRIDGIAREGVLFERTFSTSAATPISHASILTGLNPYRHGVRVISAASGYRLGEEIPTLTTLLKAEGYATAAVHSSFTVSGTFGFGTGFDHFDEVAARLEPDPDDAFVDWDVAAFQRRADETSARAIALLDRLPEPFFLWIHYWDPHDEFKLPPRAFLRADVPLRSGSDALYAEEVRFVDRELGRVVDHLHAAGRWDETIAVVTADHGQGLSDGLEQHGWRGHRLLYHQQIDVPLILRAPGIAAGQRVPGLVRTIDILPTLLDLLGIPTPAEVEGASLRPLLEGRPDPHAPRMAYADQLNGYDRNARMVRRMPSADFLYAVNDGTWKLVYRPSRPEGSELFHVEDDPAERRNLFATRPEEAKRLLTELARRAPFVDRPFPAAGDGLSAAERQALVALGYVEAPETLEAPDGGAGQGPEWGWRCPGGGPIASQPGRCGEDGTPMVLVARPAARAGGTE